MKKIFTIIMALLIVVSLAGCGNHSTNVVKDPEQTSGNHSTSETKDPVETETPTKQDDPFWTPPEAADPVITKKYDNPNDDPRMIEQKNWQPGHVAFIDQYNLIGYSNEDTTSTYYLDENLGYVPKASSNYEKFITPPTQQEADKAKTHGYTHLGHFDLEGWINSLNINVSSIYWDSDCISVDFENGRNVYFDIYSVGYSTPYIGKYTSSWLFNSYTESDQLVAMVDGEDRKMTSSLEMMWVIEQALQYANDGIDKNPW